MESSNYKIESDAVLLKADDVARILNISRSFAYQLMCRGEIPVVRLGRATRVRPSDLDRFISANVSSDDSHWPGLS